MKHSQLNFWRITHSQQPLFFYSLMSRYRRIFHELVKSIASKNLKQYMDVSESVASALYEISYLRADEYMRATARYSKENQNRSKYGLPQQFSDIGMSKHSKVTKMKEDKHIYTSYGDRQKAAFFVQSTSRCLRVPWLICGDILNAMKLRVRRNVTMNTGRESSHEIIDVVRQLLSWKECINFEEYSAFCFRIFVQSKDQTDF